MQSFRRECEYCAVIASLFLSTFQMNRQWNSVKNVKKIYSCIIFRFRTLDVPNTRLRRDSRMQACIFRHFQNCFETRIRKMLKSFTVLAYIPSGISDTCYCYNKLRFSERRKKVDHTIFQADYI